jgi:hypothetical protein
MKTRNALLIFILSGAIVTIGLWLRPVPKSRRQPGVAQSETAVLNSQSNGSNTKAESTNRPETPSPAGSTAEIPTYQMERMAITSDPNGEAKLPKMRPFQLRGGGSSTAKIVDLEGKTVLDAYPYNTIATCSVSPGGGAILVYHGNSEYEIFDPATKSRAVLPQRPPGEKKLDFSAWHWIDDTALVGQSGDELADRKDIAGEDTMDIQGRLYFYNVSRKELAEVQLPKDLGAKVFSVTQISPNGYIHLISVQTNATVRADLGWFKVRPK